MKRYFALRVLKFILFAVLGVLVFGLVVMKLWNWLIPPMFGVHPVTFAQALGLLILGKILFGGFHRGGGHGRWRSGLRDRWEKMTPEEREKFRAGMYRCGHRAAQQATTDQGTTHHSGGHSSGVHSSGAPEPEARS